MLYLLLTIIAVGVLLCSKAGKKILKFLVAISFIGLIIILCVGLYQDEGIKKIMGWVVCGGILVWCLADNAKDKLKTPSKGNNEEIDTLDNSNKKIVD